MGATRFRPTRKSRFSFLATILVLCTVGLVMALSASAAPGAVDHLGVTAPEAATSGESISVSVSALDANDNVGSDYAGTITFSSSDGKAILPDDYTYVSDDQGVQTFDVSLKSIGSETITATDTEDDTILGQATVTVAPAAFDVTAPDTATSGEEISVRVTALDADGDVGSDYTGTITFASSDGKAILPDDYTYVSDDQGVQTFDVTLEAAGSQTITATDADDDTILGQATVNVAPTAFDVTAPAAATSGEEISVTVSALDANDDVGSGYTGTITFTSSDGSATLPDDYTYVSDDQGSQTFDVTLDTTGTQTITATDTDDDTILGQATVTIAPTAFAVTAPAKTISGQAISVSVSALDANDEVGSSYTGTITFTSGDGKAILPDDYTFVSDDQGVQTFDVTLETTGTQTITATDTGDGTILGQATVTVAPAAFDVTAPDTAASGEEISVSVSALDEDGDVGSGYAGTITFTSSDGQAILPDDYTFVSDDQGSQTFDVTLETAGTQTITATDADDDTILGQATVTIAPTAFAVTAPAKTISGQAISVSVSALDADAGEGIDYAGTITFTSSDGKAILPDDYTFVSDDQGSQTFDVTLEAAGTQTITATDTGDGTILGQTTVTVAPAAFAVTAPDTATSGDSISVSVSALDANDDVGSGYAGTITFTSSDGQAILPDDYTFVSDDQGVQTFDVSLKSVGSDTITASDTDDDTILGQTTVTVAPATFDVTAPEAATSGKSISVSVTALDADGDAGTDYAGTITFTSSDGKAALPDDYTFDAGDQGAQTFDVTLEATGTQTITATDTGDDTILGQATVTVAPAAFDVTAPATTTSGESISVSVGALDTDGDITPDYAGTITFTSSDGKAILPDDYTYVSDDQGSQTFDVTLEATGTQTITATDADDGTIVGHATVTVAPAAFAVTAPATATSGESISVSVSALDANDDVGSGYRGTITFASSDGKAILPHDYTFVAKDKGARVFTVTLKSVGSETITVTDADDDTILGQATVTVALAAFGVTATTTTTSGEAIPVSVSALDADGVVASGYTGTITFTSSDSKAILPDDYTFDSGDQGAATFEVTLETAGSKTITVTDTVSKRKKTIKVSVTPDVAGQLRVTAPGAAINGQPFSVKVSALDAAGNSTGYTGTVTFTSSDGEAILPHDYKYVAKDKGARVFTVTLKSVGSETITATDADDGTILGQATVNVTAGPVTHFSIAGVKSTVSGTQQSFTVKALNAYNQVVESYAGTVHVTSSDSKAILPDDYTFDDGDQGTATFEVTLETTGSKTVSFTDTVTKKQVSIKVSVSSAAASSLRVTAPGAAINGQPFSVKVSALDAAGNATGYTGTVTFTSSDGEAILPHDYKYVAKDKGARVFTVTLKSVGSETITATDADDGTILGQATVNVTAGPVTHFSIAGVKSTVSGTQQSFTVKALNAYNQVVESYAGTVHVTSSDSKAILPDDYTFDDGDQGTATFEVTLETTGSKTVSFTDTVTKKQVSIKVSVSSAAASSLRVTAPGAAINGQPFSVKVSALDAAGNSTGYTGTVTFTSSDGEAILPHDYKYVAKDKGARVFTVTLKSVGSETITATDADDGTILGQATVNVTAGPVTHFSIAGVKSTVSGTQQSFTVKALNAYNQVVESYAGTVHVTSSDSKAILPDDYTFDDGDQGTATFEVTLETTGSKTVSFTDTVTKKQVSIKVSVSSAAASSLRVTAPGAAINGQPFSVKVSALDAAGNSTGYTGTVTFTSSDGEAILPHDYKYVAKDKGARVFTVTLKSVGSETITATDADDGTILGQATVNVTAGPVTHFSIAGVKSTVSGTQQSFTVKALNAYNQVVESYAGTVHVTSSDSKAILPDDYTFDDGDQGTATFEVTLETTGSKTVSFTDTVTKKQVSIKVSVTAS